MNWAGVVRGGLFCALSGCAGSFEAGSDFGKRRAEIVRARDARIHAGVDPARWRAGRCGPYVVLYWGNGYDSRFEYFDRAGGLVGTRVCTDTTSNGDFCTPSERAQPRCADSIDDDAALLPRHVSSDALRPRVSVICDGEGCDHQPRFSLTVDGVLFREDNMVTFRAERGEIALQFPARVRFSYAMTSSGWKVDLLEADATLRVQRQGADYSDCVITRADGAVFAVVEIRSAAPIAESSR